MASDRPELFQLRSVPGRGKLGPILLSDGRSKYEFDGLFSVRTCSDVAADRRLSHQTGFCADREVFFVEDQPLLPLSFGCPFICGISWWLFVHKGGFQ